MTRECGSCTECCYTLGVHELDKAAFTRCAHEGRHGCQTYGTRPESCRTYNCCWLQGTFDRKDRPDRIGIVFSTAEAAGRQIVLAHVRRPGADRAGRGQELIALLAQQVPVAIIRPDGSRSCAIPELLGHLIPAIMRELEAVAEVDGTGQLRRLPLV